MFTFFASYLAILSSECLDVSYSLTRVSSSFVSVYAAFLPVFSSDKSLSSNSFFVFLSPSCYLSSCLTLMANFVSPLSMSPLIFSLPYAMSLLWLRIESLVSRISLLSSSILISTFTSLSVLSSKKCTKFWSPGSAISSYFKASNGVILIEFNWLCWLNMAGKEALRCYKLLSFCFIS